MSEQSKKYIPLDALTKALQYEGEYVRMNDLERIFDSLTILVEDGAIEEVIHEYVATLTADGEFTNVPAVGKAKAARAELAVLQTERHFVDSTTDAWTIPHDEEIIWGNAKARAAFAATCGELAAKDERIAQLEKVVTALAHAVGNADVCPDFVVEPCNWPNVKDECDDCWKAYALSKAKEQ